MPLHKKKREEELKVEFVTSLLGGRQYPILPTHKVVPEWWKQMKRGIEGQIVVPGSAGTLKTCPAFTDRLKSGWIIQLPFDIYIRPVSEYGYEWTTAPTAPKLVHHPPSQSPGMPVPRGYSDAAVKVENVWAAKTPVGWSLKIDRVPFEFDPPFDVYPTIVDTDYHHFLIPVFRYRWMDRGDQLIQAGTPLCSLTLVNREAEATFESVHIENPDRYNELTSISMGGVGGGRRLIRDAYRVHGKWWKKQHGVKF